MDEYLFDTNIFNRALDGNIDFSELSGKNCYVTHIQFDEIQATKDNDRRSELNRVFSQIGAAQLPTESFVIDISSVDKAKVSDGLKHDEILQRLNELNNSRRSNRQDALIAETSLNNSLILVTEDRDLAQVIRELGGSVCNLQDVISA